MYSKTHHFHSHSILSRSCCRCLVQFFPHVVQNSFYLLFHSWSLQHFSPPPIHFISHLESFIFLNQPFQRNFNPFCEFLVTHFQKPNDALYIKLFFHSHQKLASRTNVRKLELKHIQSGLIDGKFEPFLDEDKLGFQTADRTELQQNYLINTSGYCLIMSLPISLVNLKCLNSFFLRGMTSNG